MSMTSRSRRDPDKPPDLQKLVARYPYWEVPPAIWEQYREAVRAWETRVRSGARYGEATAERRTPTAPSDNRVPADEEPED